MANKSNRSKIDRIIEDATVDAYGEEEQTVGWESLLTASIKTPQECFVGKVACALLGIAGNGRCISAKVRAGKITFTTNIEGIRLKDKRRQLYIDAYKEWL